MSISYSDEIERQQVIGHKVRKQKMKRSLLPKKKALKFLKKLSRLAGSKEMSRKANEHICPLN